MPEPLMSESAGDVTYRPLSAWAVAGLGVSILYALLVLFSGWVALSAGAPIFFPGWIHVIPIVAFVLCLVGRNQILGSEDTRAGLKLAQTGMWLSLFTGLGYFTYVYAIGLAVTAQANQFLLAEGPDTGFFPIVQKSGEKNEGLNAAFLLTQPAGSRGSIAPTEETMMKASYDLPGPDAAPGPLTQFRDHFLIRALARGGEQVAIEPLAIQDWSHQNRSYKVIRNYRIHTPEFEVEATLPVESSEPIVEGERRKWHLNFREMRITDNRKKYTALGAGIQNLRMHAREVLMRKGLSAVSPGGDPSQQDRTDWQKLLPEEEGKAKVLRKALHQSLLRKRADEPGLEILDASLWGRENGRIWLGFNFRLMAPPDQGFEGYTMQGMMRLESGKPVNPEDFATSPPIFDSLSWELKEVRVIRTQSARKFN